MSQSQGIEARRLSRRTIATGAAWAVPVIAVGAAAPLAAASGGVIITPLPGNSCKFPGQSTGFSFGYKMFFNINTSVATNFCVTGATVPGNTAAEVQIFQVNNDASAPYCVALVPGDNTVSIIVGSTNSANGTGTFTYTLDGAAGGTFTATFGNFPPCK
jgi:hypothetical protein